MNWRAIIKLLLPIIIEIIGNLEVKDECPDGVCPPVVEDLRALQTQLDEPSVQSTGDFFKCFDFQRFFNAVTEIANTLRDSLSGVCPPEEPSPDPSEPA